MRTRGQDGTRKAFKLTSQQINIPMRRLPVGQKKNTTLLDVVLRKLWRIYA